MNAVAEERCEVAIVGGGPAGAALATRLALAGVEVACFERAQRPRWRACGVWSSPATRHELLELGLSPETVARLCRPIAAMEVESLRGPRLRLDYPAPDHAVGIDRVRFERALLDRAAEAGATIHEGATVRDVTLDGTSPRLTVSDRGGTRTVRARSVVGADGPRSLVARHAGVSRAVPLRRAGVTVHRPDPQAPRPNVPMTARMIVGRGWYCGIAPVPDGRVNIGIVLPAGRFRSEIHDGGPQALVERITAALPAPVEAWRACPDSDEVRVAVPLAHRVTRSAGPGWLLVGDATGFLDPLSGEGIHRALVSARMATRALTGGDGHRPAAWAAYDREVRRTFRPKDVVSWLLQLFMSRPLLFDHAVRRLAADRDLSRTFGLVMADLEPAGRVLDPRFLVRLLAP